MGRPHVPTAVHRLKGTMQAHPERMRARENEPVPEDGLGECPAMLAPEVRQAWHSIVDGCAPGVLTSMDRVTMELAATLLARFRSDPMECHVGVVARLHALLGSMGMTPADRSKVAVVKRQERKNPFQALLAGRSGTSQAS